MQSGNGPETFQIVTNSDAEIAALPYIGKSIALKANELSCAQVGQLSDATARSSGALSPSTEILTEATPALV
jgi:hypothetical protein